MSDWYILNGKTPVECENLTEWATRMKNCNRIVKQSKFGNVKVSTIFLGLDHSFDGCPVLFETMIFGGKHDGYQYRYSTWDEAEAGHEIACKLVNKC